jgi:hypothetical protein
LFVVGGFDHDGLALAYPLREYGPEPVTYRRLGLPTNTPAWISTIHRVRCPRSPSGAPMRMSTVTANHRDFFGGDAQGPCFVDQNDDVIVAIDVGALDIDARYMVFDSV